MLELDDLHKRYGDVVALDGAGFTVQRGTMLGFLGPNGAGKTTTMRAIFGLLTLDSGTVRWDGQPIDAAARLRFGYMPEQRGLYPKMKSREQLIYLGRLHGMTASAAADATDALLEELGLADRANDPVEKLSHGNQQRIQLAAALVHDPVLMVLDEPFNGLDPIGAETMARVLRERAARGAAVVFSSHQLDLVEDLCEDVAIIHRGRIVLTGNVDQLKDASPIRRLDVETMEGDLGSLSGIDGIVSSHLDGRTHRLVVSHDTDVRRLLAPLSDSGGLRHFNYSTPSLSDLFKEAIA